MIALLAAAVLSFGSACSGGLCSAGALDPWNAKLARLAAPGGHSGKPLHILQIGDSHTAGDGISGPWREALQARYGAGGRGVLAPGRPYDGYVTRGVTVSMTPGWTTYADFGKGWTDPHPPLGLSGFSMTSQVPGAGMTLDADGQERFNRLVVCAIARPGAGNLLIHLGPLEQRMSLGAPSDRPQCRTFHSPDPQTHADLVTEDGPVTLTSWGTFADGFGGVALSNVGVVGSQLIHFSRTDDGVLSEELRAYDPDLIVIAFGTNEGFAGRFSPFEYEVVLRSQIGRIRRLAGNVPILLLGAPDALTRRAELRDNTPGIEASLCPETGAAAVAPSAPPPPSAAANFSGAMATISNFLGLTAASESGAPVTPTGRVVQPLPAQAAAAPARSGLFPPAALTAVRDVQRRVAAQLHVAYWDWEGRMGGRCTALRWARQSPPLMRGDYVHYTSAGGREIATRLQADLDRAAGQ